MASSSKEEMELPEVMPSKEPDVLETSFTMIDFPSCNAFEKQRTLFVLTYIGACNNLVDILSWTSKKAWPSFLYGMAADSVIAHPVI